MRKTVFMVIAFVLLAFGVALAEEAGKFAIIDVQRIVSDSKKGKAAIEEVKKYTAKKREEAEKKLAERDNKGKELEKQIQSGIVSEAAMKEKIEEFQNYAREVEEFARKAEQDARKFAEERETDVKIALERIVEKLGKDGNYLMIFRYENLVYNAPSIPDITDQVISAYDSSK